MAEIRRVTGTEIELGAMVSNEHSDELKQLNNYSLQDSVVASLAKNEIEKTATTGGFFLSNGARFYKDVGDTWEYATPEDDSVVGTCANEIAAEKIIEDVSRHAQESMEQPVSLTRRVITDKYVGSGYHMSILGDAERVKINSDNLALYGVFAATRSILFGAGALLPGGQFVLGQKALTLNCDYHTDTTRNKPVVNLRDQSHAKEGRHIRLHDTSGDPTLSPWATRVKTSAASIVLTMIEQDVRLPNLRFEDELHKVARAISKDLSFSAHFKLHGGGAITAITAQQIIVENAKKLAKRIDFNDEDLWALEEWERALYELSTNPAELKQKVEWVTRFKYLSKLKDKHGLSWSSPRLGYNDIQFSELSTMDRGDRRSIKQIFRETLWADYMPPQELIDSRVQLAPSSTRAKVRGEFILKAAQFDVSNIHVDWSWVKQDFKTYSILDPLANKNKKIETVMSNWEREAAA